MRRFFFIFLLVTIGLSYAEDEYQNYFTNKTLRIDYFHTGNSTQEFFSIDQIYQEQVWPGSKINLIDTLNLGFYCAKIYDAQSMEIIFSHGYCSIFGEWQTTSEAQSGTFQTMHETVRLPFPKNKIVFSISKRDKENKFVELYSITIDPLSRFINHEVKSYPFRIDKILFNGDSEKKVDILLLGDGYTKKEIKKFRRDVQRYTKALFDAEPFKSRIDDFNVWAIESISEESGIDQPRKNIWKDNLLGARYNALDLPRYVLSRSNKVIRDVASLVPYDTIFLLINSPRYGGGGIYNFQATCYTGTENDEPDWWSDYVFVHEFGHLFAGLADEYYNSTVAYNEMYPTNIEPWEPNITTLNAPHGAKWYSELKTDVNIPTFWEKAQYDSLVNQRYGLDKADSAYSAKRAKLDDLINAILFADNSKIVGCYEGAGYASEGIYRPAINCRMFSKSLYDFCPVCEKAINQVIDFYCK